jgi:hypothetical protein
MEEIKIVNWILWIWMGFCQCWMAADHSAKKATTRQKKFNFDHEIMEIGLVRSNLIENSHYSAILGRTLYGPKIV